MQPVRDPQRAGIEALGAALDAPGQPAWGRRQTLFAGAAGLLVLAVLTGALLRAGAVREAALHALQAHAREAAVPAAQAVAERLNAESRAAEALALQVDVHAALERAAVLRSALDWAALDPQERRRQLVADPALRALDRRLEQLHAESGHGVQLLDERGTCVATSLWQDTRQSCIGTLLGERADVQTAMGEGLGSHVAVAPPESTPWHFHAARVDAGSAVLGAVVVMGRLPALAPLLPPTDGLALVLDEQGVVVASADESLLLQRLPSRAEPSEALRQARYGDAPLKPLDLQRDGAQRWRFGERRLVGTALAVGDSPFQLLVLHDAQAAEAAVRQHHLRALGLLAGLLLALGLAERLVEARVQRHRDAARRDQQQAALERFAAHSRQHDARSGATAHEHFLAGLDAALARAERESTPLALLRLRIDCLGRVNDQHGHAAGDAVLAEIAFRAQALCRPSDQLGRLGGAAFALLLPGSTAAQALALAERLRARVAEQPVPMPGGTQVWASATVVAVAREPGEDRAALLARAEAALRALPPSEPPGAATPTIHA